MDHDTLKWIVTFHDTCGRLMTWMQLLNELDFQVLYFSGLVHQVHNALSRLLRPFDTQNCEPINDEIPIFEFSPVALEQRLDEKGVLYASFSYNSFKTTITLTKLHTASHTPLDDIPDDDSDTNDCIIVTKMPKALDDLAVPLSTLK